MHDFVSKARDASDTLNESNCDALQQKEQEQKQKQEVADEKFGQNSPLKSSVPQRVRAPSPITQE